MHRMAMVLTMAVAMFGASMAAVPAEVKSLRGDVPLDAGPRPPDLARVMTREGGFARAWKLQPPLVPHKVDRERINREVNTCLRCHAPENYKREHAPMISRTHFTDAKNPSRKNLMAGRWFCNQCHVPQVNAQPLVENLFGR